MGMTPSTISSEQFAARELVRDWAAGSGATAAVRDIEQGEPKAWRPVFDGLAGLGLFGVAVPEECGGAGGSIEDLSAMVEEAARALVPGPVATTALATLVVSDPQLREALAAGERTAGVALGSDVEFDATTSRASGTVPFVLGGVADGLLLVAAADSWLLIDATAEGVAVELLQASDFSRPLARAVLTSAPASVLDAPADWVTDLTATVLCAEAAGITRWTLDTAVAYAKVREQFGKPIGSFQLIQDLLVKMLGNITACQTMCFRLSQLQDSGKLKDELASLAKSFCTVKMRESVGWARELLGANGILLDYNIGRFVADSEAIYSYEGTREMNTLIVGKAITGLSAFV